MFGLSTRRYNNMLGFDPFRDMEEMERRFFAPSAPAFGFRTDILEEDGGYKLQADLPGFDKEDIHVDVEGDLLTISAERREENEENRDGYVRRERRFGSYKRSFDVSEIDQDAIAGDYTNGVLTLHLPRKEAEAPAAKRIELS
ncbi:MAG: Hsp20/alpha crystallin family protein [Oscillospiraceae bacterium]|nr:Hsp20/alpha crystallin family protein [Oscillospiraceae bacterium]MBR5045103.1 Hsp20/alpha crystallin family protein [Oscillospiraceae bacterium]MBR5071600.1 Hsp20/alpha crystallin family protein [Oscillospiraceae bacterium]